MSNVKFFTAAELIDMSDVDIENLKKNGTFEELWPREELLWRYTPIENYDKRDEINDRLGLT